MFPRIHFDRISDQLHTDIWTRLSFLVMFANVDFEVFKKNHPNLFLSKNPWQFLRNSIISNLYWHQLKSMIRGECDPITFTRTATASAALVVGIEPNPKNTSLWKMAKSQNSIIFVMITGCMMVCRIWGKDDDRFFCFYGRRTCHVLFCRGEATELWEKTLIWCSDNFRQFQVVLEYHIPSTIWENTIEPNHIMALVNTAAGIQISTVDSVESDSPSHVGESKNCWLNRASVQSVGQNVWSWFGCSALLIVAVITVYMWLWFIMNYLFLTSLLNTYTRIGCFSFRAFLELIWETSTGQTPAWRAKDFGSNSLPTSLLIFDGSWWSNIDNGSPPKGLRTTFWKYSMEAFSMPALLLSCCTCPKSHHNKEAKGAIPKNILITSYWQRTSHETPWSTCTVFRSSYDES